MTRYIAILRGINVGGNRKILMADLRKLVEKLGFSNVQTYIQSGNVIFDGVEVDSNLQIGDTIQQAILETYGFDVPVIVRTAGEMSNSIANNPFLSEINPDLEKLFITFMKDEASIENIEKIITLEFKPDLFRIIGKDVFGYCENGFGRTKITNDFFEKKLKVQTKTRNWKTVMKLNEMSREN